MKETTHESAGQTEMPRYLCHKEVWALQIKDVIRDADVAHAENRETDGSAMIVPIDGRYAPIRVDSDYLRKHQPKIGGYYVVYPPDGYKSFSPAKAFEDGYTLIT